MGGARSGEEGAASLVRKAITRSSPPRSASTVTVTPAHVRRAHRREHVASQGGDGFSFTTDAERGYVRIDGALTPSFFYPAAPDGTPSLPGRRHSRSYPSGRRREAPAR